MNSTARHQHARRARPAQRAEAGTTAWEDAVRLQRGRPRTTPTSTPWPARCRDAPRDRRPRAGAAPAGRRLRPDPAGPGPGRSTTTPARSTRSSGCRSRSSSSRGSRSATVHGRGPGEPVLVGDRAHRRRGRGPVTAAQRATTVRRSPSRRWSADRPRDPLPAAHGRGRRRGDAVVRRAARPRAAVRVRPGAGLAAAGGGRRRRRRRLAGLARRADGPAGATVRPRGSRSACSALSVAANALGHGLAAYVLLPPWWVVVILSGIAPAVLGAMVHLAVLVGHATPTTTGPTSTTSRSRTS